MKFLGYVVVVGVTMFSSFIDGKLFALSLTYIVVGGFVYTLSSNLGLESSVELPIVTVFSLVLIGVGLLTIVVRTYSVLYAASAVLAPILIACLFAFRGSLTIDLYLSAMIFIATWGASFALGFYLSSLKAGLMFPYFDLEFFPCAAEEKAVGCRSKRAIA